MAALVAHQYFEKIDFRLLFHLCGCLLELGNYILAKVFIAKAAKWQTRAL